MAVTSLKSGEYLCLKQPFPLRSKTLRRSSMNGSQPIAGCRPRCLPGKPGCTHATLKSTAMRNCERPKKRALARLTCSSFMNAPVQSRRVPVSTTRSSVRFSKERAIDQCADRCGLIDVAVGQKQVVPASKMHANFVAQRRAVFFQHTDQGLKQFGIEERNRSVVSVQRNILSLQCGNATIARRRMMTTHARRATGDAA